jgi:hypothetical protein
VKVREHLALYFRDIRYYAESYLKPSRLIQFDELTHPAKENFLLIQPAAHITVIDWAFFGKKYSP